MKKTSALSEAEALGLLLKAVRRFGSYRGKEALASLPRPVRAAAQVIGWRAICLSRNQDTLRSHFFKTYSQLEAKDVGEQLTLLKGE